MTWTQTQLDALKVAYAQGVTSVSHNGKTVNYASMAELWRAIQNLEREVNPTPATTRPNMRKIRFGEAT